MFKKIYKCQHNEKNKSKHIELKRRNRNLKCDATITILIKKITKDTIKNDNLLKDGLNTEIKVRDNIVYIFKQYNISYRIFTLLYHYTYIYISVSYIIKNTVNIIYIAYALCRYNIVYNNK